MNNVIVDILHLFLRVSDKLEDLFYQKIEYMDNKENKKIKKLIADRKTAEKAEKAKQQKNKRNKKSRKDREDSEDGEDSEDTEEVVEDKEEEAMDKNRKKFVEFLEGIKIKKPYNESSKEFRGFNGVEKLKIFKNINFGRLFPDMEKTDIIQFVWDEFYQIVDELKRDVIDTSTLKSKTGNFFKNFVKTTFDLSTIPYIHIFISHLHQQNEYLKSKKLFINDFSMQGIEKLNDLITKYYQRSSNKKGNFLSQVLEKRSRIEIINQHMNVNSLLNEST